MSDFKKKIMDRMFKKVEGVVIDMTSNSIGVEVDGSIFSLIKDGSDYGITENIFTKMSLSIPAFAQQTTLDKIVEGDLVLNNKGDILGWVIKKMAKTLRILEPSGQVITTTPIKANMIGMGQTVMAVSSMAGDNLQGSLPMLMAMSDDSDSMDEMIPMMLMSQGGGMDPNMAMMMAMSSGDSGDGGDMMKTMAMMSMMNPVKGSIEPPALNPMMLMALLK